MLIQMASAALLTDRKWGGGGGSLCGATTSKRTLVPPHTKLFQTRNKLDSANKQALKFAQS